jgi:YD repeat-containing protein
MKAAFSVFVFVFASIITKAQNSFQNLVNVSTTSPEAASIGKFGNVPVSYATGVPGITIPVYEINIGKIKLPISFDYHAGGIRVDEVASSVGLGWALNGIGVISRNMVGQPDEGPGAYLKSPSFDSLYAWQTNQAYYGQSYDNKYSEYLLQMSMLHQNETEPDVYSYTINGQSGKFIFRKDGSVMQIPKTNNLIVKNGNDFSVTDENGVVYIFDQKEITEYVGASASPYYYSTWRLSKMIDPNTQDIISFIYEAACDLNVNRYENFGYTLGYGPNCEGSNAVSYFGPNNSASTVYHHNELFIKEINWRGGKLSFNNTCGRQDKASEKRLDEINVYSTQNDQLTLVKKIKLFQTYFFSDPIPYGTVTEKNYRLKLDSVGFMSTSDAQAYYYRMTYNTSQPMAPRESYAQDKWGFNNGQFSNTSLMPNQTVLYNGAYYTIGTANREPNEQLMQACTINSIVYPTKGKTVFEFEPHKYNTDITETVNRSLHCDAYGGVQETNTITFTADANEEGYRYNVYISSYNYSNVFDRPRVRITDLNTSETWTLGTNMDPNNSYSTGTLVLNVVTGHTYSVTTNIYTANSNVIATATITWSETSTSTVIKTGGGLRVRSVANYDLDGKFINKDEYKYGATENGIGQLLTKASYLLVNYENVRWRCGPSSGACILKNSLDPLGAIYHANSVYPASQYSGSPVLYSNVTKYLVNAAGNAINGKSKFQYKIYEDQPLDPFNDVGKVGVLMIGNEWKNGFLELQEDYKYNSITGQYNIVYEKRNDYQAQRTESMLGLKVTTRVNFVGGCYYSYDVTWAKQDFTLFRIPVNTGAMLLQSTKETSWDDNNNMLVTTQNFYYNDTRHLFTTKAESLNSKAEMTTENLKYPHDFASPGNVYQKMVDRNIVSPVVTQQHLLNGVQLSLSKINYNDWFGDTKLLMPQSAEQQIAANPVETRVRFSKFDIYGNILEQQKENDILQSYIWDYSSVYPVAQSSNTSYNAMAYTSFEADGAGNWSIGSSTRGSNGATGKKSYSLANGAVSRSGLTASVVYTVSYWSANGAYSVTGTTGSVVQGKTINVNGVNWTYYQHQVTGVTTATITGSGSIDELRLHPKDARMATFTYLPLIGMTSKCDEVNHITYYEYDGLGRLSLIRDEDGNILKKISYSYAGQ